MKHSRYSTLLRLLLVLVATAGLLYWGADTQDRFRLGLHSDQIARSPFHLDADTRKVTGVESEAAHAGLVTGVTIESLNGVPYTGVAQWEAVNSPAQPGDVLLVGFRRSDGTSGTVQIALVAQPSRPGMPTGLSQTWQNFALFGLMPLFCMLVGYWVVLAKPDDPNAWLLLLLLLFPGDFFSYGNGLSTGGWHFCSSPSTFRSARASTLRCLGSSGSSLAPLCFAAFCISARATGATTVRVIRHGSLIRQSRQTTSQTRWI